MSKGIELTPTQIKAYENGATMFLFPTNKSIIREKHLKDIFAEYIFINKYSPIQKGDYDIFVQEEFFEIANGDLKYKCRDYDENSKFNKIELWTHASKMTKEQSRYSFSECIDVRVIRVQDIEFSIKMELCKNHMMKSNPHHTFINFYNQQLKELNINRRYEDKDTDYVFLVEFKR